MRTTNCAWQLQIPASTVLYQELIPLLLLYQELKSLLLLYQELISLLLLYQELISLLLLYQKMNIPASALSWAKDPYQELHVIVSTLLGAACHCFFFIRSCMSLFLLY